MQVRLKLGEPLWRSAGKREIAVPLPGETASLSDLYGALRRDYPALAEALGHKAQATAPPFTVFVNYTQVQKRPVHEVALQAGDVVSIVIPIAGGAPLPEESLQRLLRAFYDRPVLQVARDLLGRRLVRLIDGERVSGRLVEVEAYHGPQDPASHGYRGKTARTAVMFGPPGYAYVYFIYGVHFCMNVVCEAEGDCAAVLLRGLEPEEGLESMRHNRQIAPGRRGPGRELTNGPAKLAQALQITRSFQGVDLVSSPDLFLENGVPVLDDLVLTGPRVGIEGVRDEEARLRPWRFYVRGNPYVSR